MDEHFLRELINGKEDEHCEFKEAKQSFDFQKLLKYCSAISNEGGGHLILGVTDKKPRAIVGTSEFSDTDRVKKSILDKLMMRVDIFEFTLPERVLVFKIRKCPSDQPVHVEGAYYMRSGESLVPMSPDRLREFFQNQVNDYSEMIIEGLSINDLDEDAISILRKKWSNQNEMLQKNDCKDFLNDCKLMKKDKVSLAGLVILGKQQSIESYLPQSETIFEYRNTDTNINYDKRIEYRKGIILVIEDIWKIIDTFNTVQSFQNGLYRQEICTFNEEVIREILLNAFIHRDYRNGNSIIVKMTPSCLYVKSPGGLPNGVSILNIIDDQYSRNRLISETMQRIRYVERSGQGYDKVWQRQTLESKPGPDLSETDDYQVCVKVSGIVHDPKLFEYLSKINSSDLNVHELVVINLISFEMKIPAFLSKFIDSLLTKKYIEKIGTGKGTRYILSKDYYDFSNKKGEYSRKLGLSDSQNKQLILEHIKRYKMANIKELEQVISNERRSRLHLLLNQLKSEGKIMFFGSKKSGKWVICE